MKGPDKDTPARSHKLPSGRSVLVSGETAQVPSSSELAFFANYAEYSKTLRAWLVAYGIGGPVLFLTNNELAAALKLSQYKDWIVGLFMLGVALQVTLAFINKWCAWHMYVGEHDNSYQNRTNYKFWFWLNERSWIDLLIDGSSLIAFSISTFLAIRVFT